MQVIFHMILIVRKKPVLRLLLLAALTSWGWESARATTFLELQSTYLGDGWFQYRMSVMNDPFFTEADIPILSFIFTNQIDQSTTSTNWVNSHWTNATSDWMPTNGYPARPYTTMFLMRSSETSYRLATGTNATGALVLMSLVPAECYPGNGPTVYFVNIVGYAFVPCLVPCRPEDADGSPTNFVYDLKLVPDVNINRLVQENGIIDGVDFNYDFPSTFLLQGSSDLSHWTNIAYLWSYPPETVWTTNVSLGDYGQFFKLALVAGIHMTNLPPLNSAPQMAPKPAAKTSIATTTPRVTGCRLTSGKVAVSVTTNPGQTVQVQAVDSHRVVKQTQKIVAQDASATVSFDAASLPNPVFFQASVAQ